MLQATGIATRRTYDMRDRFAGRGECPAHWRQTLRMSVTHGDRSSDGPTEYDIGRACSSSHKQYRRKSGLSDISVAEQFWEQRASIRLDLRTFYEMWTSRKLAHRQRRLWDTKILNVRGL